MYNGDFELYDTCPTQASYPSLLEIKKCKGWYPPTLGTSDYFNSCANGINGANGNVWIPNNFIGFQNAYDGNGYIGLFALEDVNIFPCQYREYIQTKLLAPLEAGKKYTLSYYVSLANYQAAVNSISALFTNSKIYTTDNCFIKATPQIKYSGGYLSDTLGWTKVEGSFEALGGENYLTLGFFEDTLKHQGVLPLISDTISLGLYSVYYYIDGIYLSEVKIKDTTVACNVFIPNVFTPNNDGYNNDFNFKTCGTDCKTIIYNRWGNKVFETSQSNRFWDGNNEFGNPYPSGTYYYIIKTKEDIYKGFIQLIR